MDDWFFVSIFIHIDILHFQNSNNAANNGRRGKNIPTQQQVYRFISNISVLVDQIATINSIYWPKATKLSVFCCFSVYLPTRTLSMLSVSGFSRAFQSISGYLKALQAIENHIWTFQSISKHSKDTSTSLIGKDKIPAKSQSIANNRRNNSTGRLFVLNEMNEASTSTSKSRKFAIILMWIY